AVGVRDDLQRLVRQGAEDADVSEYVDDVLEPARWTSIGPRCTDHDLVARIVEADFAAGDVSDPRRRRAEVPDLARRRVVQDRKKVVRGSVVLDVAVEHVAPALGPEVDVLKDGGFVEVQEPVAGQVPWR